ncbi:MAG TPA: flippase [Thermoplasmata archaeon]|nr:flippase [Thermoplasmata archaeon]
MGETGTPPKPKALVSLGRGTMTLVVTTALLFLFNFIGRVAVARAFGDSNWGLFSLGLALTQVFVLVGLLGLHQASARMLSFERDPAVRWTIVRWTLSLTMLAAVLGSVLTFVFAPELAGLFANGANAGQLPELTVVFQMFSITIGFSLMSLFLAALFQGFEDATPNGWFNQALNPGLFVVFVFLFIVLHLHFFGSLLAYVLANALALTALALYTWRRLPRHLPRPTTPTPTRPPKQLWELSFSLWGVSALAFVTAYVDTIILGIYYPSNVVGWYSSAIVLARLLLVGSGALTYIFLPVTARLAAEGDLESVRSTYVTSTRWILVVTVPLFLLFAFMPGASLSAVFGGSFVNGAAALEIITWGSLVSVAIGPVNAALAGLGRSRLLLVCTAASAVSNLVLSFTLIPRFGIIGASVAWTVARVVYPALGLYALYTTAGVSPARRSLLAPLTLSLAIGIPLFALVNLLALPAWVVFPMYFVGVGVFLLSMFATRSVDSGDLMAASAVERILGRPLPRLREFLERFIRTEGVPRAAAPP